MLQSFPKGASADPNKSEQIQPESSGDKSGDTEWKPGFDPHEPKADYLTLLPTNQPKTDHSVEQLQPSSTADNVVVKVTCYP